MQIYWWFQLYWIRGRQKPLYKAASSLGWTILVVSALLREFTAKLRIQICLFPLVVSSKTRHGDSMLPFYWMVCARRFYHKTAVKAYIIQLVNTLIRLFCLEFKDHGTTESRLALKPFIAMYWWNFSTISILFDWLIVDWSRFLPVHFEMLSSLLISTKHQNLTFWVGPIGFLLMYF